MAVVEEQRGDQNPVNQQGGLFGPPVMDPAHYPGQPDALIHEGEREALQRLLQILNGPGGPHQQTEVLQHLKIHPWLMACFIRHRQLQQQREREALPVNRGG